MEPNLVIFGNSRNSRNHFPRMALVSRMIVMLNHLCWVLTRISIAEGIAVESRSTCSYRLWWACTVLMNVKRTEELLRDQPANKEKAIVQGRAPWTWQRR